MKTTPPSEDEPLLTVDEVAERLNVSTKTVRRWIKTGELPAYRLGRQIRISEKDLRRFLRDRWSG